MYKKKIISFSFQIMGALTIAFSSPVSDFIDAISENSPNPKPYKIGILARMPYDNITYKIHFHIGQPEEPIIYQIENPHWKPHHPEITLGIDEKGGLTFYEGEYRGCVVIRQGTVPGSLHQVLSGNHRYVDFIDNPNLPQPEPYYNPYRIPEDPHSIYLDFYRYVGAKGYSYDKTGEFSYKGLPVMSIRIDIETQNQIKKNIYSGNDGTVPIQVSLLNRFDPRRDSQVALPDLYALLVFTEFEFVNFKKRK